MDFLAKCGENEKQKYPTIQIKYRKIEKMIGNPKIMMHPINGSAHTHNWYVLQ